MVKRILFLLVAVGLSSFSYGQARIIMSGTIGIATNGGISSDPVYLVIDNPDDNAITEAGAPGKPAIHSESEFNIVKWNIGAGTGVYNVPFTSSTGGLPEYVAPSLTISTSGDANGSIEFATYPTDEDNSVFPSDVDHLVHLPGLLDESNSHATMDRFWIIDPSSFR
ncbi:MAG: hypothetical protein O2867_03185 [Bacteroidetes bacterium]|nr:hypothetical protein [Bacteroidota bacterium]